jgi:acyl-CoA synthetase (AMP-forming)/AMP-acid ligase II
MEWVQDRYWPPQVKGPAVRNETHFDGRPVRCFTDRPANVDAMLADIIARFPNREAIVVGGKRFTFHEIDRLAGMASAGLARLGLVPGDRVALLLGNGWEFVALFMACVRLGLICVPIGTRQQKRELEFILNNCTADVLVFDAALAANVPDPSSVPGLRFKFAVGDGSPATESFASLLQDGGPVARHRSNEEDTAVILYTSGTTGRPKGAMLTHLGIVHSALTFVRCLGLTDSDRSFLAVPISHVTGLVGSVLAPASAGACTVMLDGEYKTARFLAIAAAERISYSIAVPTIYTLCANAPDLQSHDLSRWRIGCFGGAPMPESTIALLTRTLPRLMLVNSYGATETTSPTVLMPPGLGLDHVDSVGQVVPCGDVIVVDEEGRSLPPGSVGQLRVRGPMIVRGYWDRPEANEAEFTEGYWHSGDIGTIDADGFVTILDRAKDMINRGGYKVFSAEVENVLSGHPDVLECAIIGRPDPVLGERVHAFVVARGNPVPSATSLRGFCAERMADYKVPETFDVSLLPLPRNANGKVQKVLLRAQAQPAGP